MQYLNKEAASDYFLISRIECSVGSISHAEFIDRMRCLRSMCREKNRKWFFPRLDFEGSENEAADDWILESEPMSNTKERRTSVLKETVSESSQIPAVAFFSSNAVGLSDWEFHPLDVDFFPSIPHGHYQSKKQPKLDAYQGWVYQRSRQIRREPRAAIIALWNDPKFRTVARMAIDFYLENFPKYNGWRVHLPQKIPRRR
jgi:hypothetical protein